MPKISVIVPVYNTEKYLEKCFDSLINQTMDDIEIIVVNDGSPDNSQEIIDRYVLQYPKIFKSVTQPNGGQASARNAALPLATGEFIMFVDSDDYIEPDTFEKTYNHASTHKLDILCFLWCDLSGGNKINHVWNFADCPNDVKYILNTPSPCNKLFRRSLFEENNIRFAESYIYEDLALIPTVALYTDKIGFIDDCFYNYVFHENSTMRQNKYNPKLASIYFVMDYLKNAFSGTKYTLELEYMYIEHLLHSATLRYVEFEEGKADIKKISDIMKKEFPNWRKNRYYKRMGLKYKIFCELTYRKQIGILKLIINRKGAN